MEKVLSKFIAPGNKVELQAVARVKTEDPDQQKKTYMTKVYDVLSDDRVEVLMPMEQSKLILLPIDAEYDMYFYTENGLYQCLGRIVDRYKDNNIYVLVVDLVSNLRKRQRREYYRLSCALEMNSRELLKEEIASLEKRGSQLQPGLPLKRSIIVDISGGGLRFVANHSYNKGSVILCKYVLAFELYSAFSSFVTTSETGSSALTLSLNLHITTLFLLSNLNAFATTISFDFIF